MFILISWLELLCLTVLVVLSSNIFYLKFPPDCLLCGDLEFQSYLGGRAQAVLSLHGLQGLLELHELLILLRRATAHLGGGGRLALLLVVHEVGHDVNGDWEYDGAVVLGRDTVQSLEISQLKQRQSD